MEVKRNLDNMELCPACQISLKLIMRRKDNYVLLSCDNCSLITCSPLPSQEILNKFYGDYLFNLPTDKEAEKYDTVIFKNVTKIVNDLRSVSKTGKNLLDYGGGIYSYAFARMGYNVTLIDLSPKACSYAKQKYGNAFKVINGDALALDIKKKYDVIFCNQLIEHCSDSNLFLKNLRKILATDGILIITTPNQGSKEFYFRPKWFLSYIYSVTGFNLLQVPKAIYYFMKTPWVCCDPPRHLFSFNQKNLQQLLERNGYNTVKVFTQYSTSSYYTPSKYNDFSLKSILDIFKIGLNIYAQCGIDFLRLADYKNNWGNNLVLYAKRDNKLSDGIKTNL